MLYICETGDRKQKVRNRLFKYWFDSYEFNTKYSLYTTHIVDDEGISNFAALILKNDNGLIETFKWSFEEALDDRFEDNDRKGLN